MDIGQNSRLKYHKESFAEFVKADANVVFAVLFGSAKNGSIRQGSDLDTGVYFHQPLTGPDELAYYSRLCEVDPRIERIDFVNLNRANEILAFEAIKGDFICKNDVEKNAGFFSLICRKYEDVMSNIDYQYSLREKPLSGNRRRHIIMQYNGVISKKLEKLYEEPNLIRAQGRFTTGELKKNLMSRLQNSPWPCGMLHGGMAGAYPQRSGPAMPPHRLPCLRSQRGSRGVLQ